MMVDWLTVEMADPVGIPVNDGHVCRVRTDGSLEWSTACRKQLRGSWSSSMMFRSLGAAADGVSASGLDISGNPAKFLAGHNLFGSDCPTDLLTRLLQRVGPELWPNLTAPPVLDVAGASISRIDLTGTWKFPRPEDVLPFLTAMEERVWCPYRGRGVMDSGGSTLYFGRSAKGGRAKDWALKLYWKGPEITAHPLPEPAYQVAGLLEDVNCWVRVELTLRKPELKRLGMTKVGQWTAAAVRQTWETYVSKLDFGEATMCLDIVDLAATGLKARHIDALTAWKSGNDLRAGRSKETYYRLRRDLKALTGYDIAVVPPKSNVVPLRRIIMAEPVGRPSWADELTAALARVA